MESLLLVIHAILALLLIVVVLIQRAEGGALGIGGGSDGMSPRGSADVLTRTTSIIAVLFVITSLSLTILSMRSNERSLNFESLEEDSVLQTEELPELQRTALIETESSPLSSASFRKLPRALFLVITEYRNSLPSDNLIILGLI